MLGYFKRGNGPQGSVKVGDFLGLLGEGEDKIFGWFSTQMTKATMIVHLTAIIGKRTERQQ